MKFIFTVTLFVCSILCSAQATFQSNVATGNWTAAGSWLLVSGADADGIPDNDDNVTIQTGHTINIATTTTQNCNNLTIDRGTLAYTAGSGRLNVRGNLIANSTVGTRATLSGSSNNHRIVITGSSTVNASSHLEVIGVRITANGPTVLSGLLEFTTAQTSNNTFIDVTINGSGTWTNNSTQNFAISGSLLNNSGNTMTPCSTVDGCNYVFTGDGESIDGTGTTTLSRLIINTVSITNNGTLVMNDDIVGSGTLINDGSITVNTHAGGANFTLDNFDLNNVGSSFTYQGTTNENIDITFPFYDLIVNMDNGVLLQVLNNDVSVENNLTINSGEMRVRDNRTLAVTGNLSIAGANAEFAPTSTGNIVNIGGNLLMSDGNYDQNEGDVNVTGDIILTGGTMIISETGSSTLDATDMSITDAAVTLNSGTMTISNAAGGLTSNSNAQNVVILSTLDVAGQIEVQSGTTILNAGADVSAGAITVSGGILRPNNATVILDVTGDITTSGTGLYDQNDGDVNVSGDFNLTNGSAFLDGGTLDATDMTIAIGDVQLRAGTMNVTNAAGGVTINSGRLLMNGANTLNVTNDISIAGGELLFNDNTAVINISGDLTMSSGEYDHNDGDMNVTGDIIITGGTMDLNVIATASTVDATDMTLATGTVDLRGGTLTLSNASGGLTVNSGALSLLGTTVNISGDYDINGGTNDLNTGDISFVNMDIASGGVITVANATIASSGTVTVDNGSFTIDGAAGTYNFNNIDVNTNGSWLVTAAYSPTISGSISSDGTFTGCNGAGCVYTLTSATGTISGTGAMNTMSDFLIDAPASYTNTNSGGVDISDALGGTGTFINGANGAMLYGGSNGNFTITSFTASAVGNTVTYNRTVSNQLIQPTTDAGNNYYNLIINKADGQDVTTSADITVDNQLTLTLGDIIMGGQNIIMSSGSTITGGNASSYIQDNAGGVLRYELSAVGTFFVPIGGDRYSPITLTLNSATIGGGASIDFSITDSAHPNRDRDNTGDSPAGDDDGTAATDFLDVYWTLSGNNISSPVYSASYIYDASDFTQTTESNMVGVLYRVIAGGTLDWFVAGTVNPTNNTVSISEADGFGDLYAMDNTSQRLPIVLISFKALPLINSVNLKWVTAIEENNQLFTIERSVDGKEFIPILYIEGAGTTNSFRSYSASDLDPILGRSYYRLKQTDFNGQFEYSEVISVFYEGSNAFDFGLKGNLIKTGERLGIWCENALEAPQLMIRDIKGEVLVSKKFTSDSSEIEETSQLSAGIYFLMVNYFGKVETKKFIIR